MTINLYSVDYNLSGECFEWSGLLADYIANNDIDDNEAAKMRNELRIAGRYWLGGGSQPLFLIQRA